MSTNDPKRWKYEAQIGFRPTFASILGQYQRAVDILFSQIEEGGSPVNVISYPLLFLVRHSLELGYKLNINYLSQYSQLPDKVNWNKHLLLELHDAFGRHFNAVVEKLEVDKAIADEFNSRYTEVKKLGRHLLLLIAIHSASDTL